MEGKQHFARLFCLVLIVRLAVLVSPFHMVFFFIPTDPAQLVPNLTALNSEEASLTPY